MSLDLLSLNNPVFKSYTFWAGVLVIKMLAMSLLTAVQRFKTKVSATGPHLWPADWVKVRSKSWVKARREIAEARSRSACMFLMDAQNMTQHISVFFPDIRQSRGSDVAKAEGQI